jgi:LuxR family maltose regulon positive regulatory protein
VLASLLVDLARRSREIAAGSAPAPLPSTGAASSLTQRELEVLDFIAKGQSNKMIARALELSPHTVKRHVARILDKTQQSSRVGAAQWCRQRQAAADGAPAKSR